MDPWVHLNKYENLTVSNVFVAWFLGEDMSMFFLCPCYLGEDSNYTVFIMKSPQNKK